jgi:hypothetical protein
MSGMWQKWQEKIEAGLPNFCASPLYHDQENFTDEDYRALAYEIKNLELCDEDGKDRDAEFGGRLVETCLGQVTRMWLEAQVEIDFLRRHLPSLSDCSVLDIGAGYGRLAVILAPLVRDYTCIEPVKVSLHLCRAYCTSFGKGIKVIGMGEERPITDLAINIHSWNECDAPDIGYWVSWLVRDKVPFLFTVSHGRGWEYKSYDKLNYRPTLEAHYALIAEETLGMEKCPHALWALK